MAKGKELAKAPSRAIAQQGERNAYQEAADEKLQSQIEGDILKFVKGEWTAGQDQEELEIGTELIMGINTMEWGWQRWMDNKPTDFKMGLIGERYTPALREELGDLDEEKWEENLDGNGVRDPWQYVMMVKLVHPETGQVYTYYASSKGGQNELLRLSRAYGNRVQDGNDGEEMPVVALGKDHYMHKKFGKTQIPVFKLTDKWLSPADIEIPEPEEKPKAKAKAKAQPKAQAKAQAAPRTATPANGRTAPKALPAPRKGGGAASRI